LFICEGQTAASRPAPPPDSKDPWRGARIRDRTLAARRAQGSFERKRHGESGPRFATTRERTRAKAENAQMGRGDRQRAPGRGGGGQPDTRGRAGRSRRDQESAEVVGWARAVLQIELVPRLALREGGPRECAPQSKKTGRAGMGEARRPVASANRRRRGEKGRNGGPGGFSAGPAQAARRKVLDEGSSQFVRAERGPTRPSVRAAASGPRPFGRSAGRALQGRRRCRHPGRKCGGSGEISGVAQNSIGRCSGERQARRRERKNGDTEAELVGTPSRTFVGRQPRAVFSLLGSGAGAPPPIVGRGPRAPEPRRPGLRDGETWGQRPRARAGRKPTHDRVDPPRSAIWLRVAKNHASGGMPAAPVGRRMGGWPAQPGGS